MFDPDYQYGYHPRPDTRHIPEGKHILEFQRGNFVCVAENNPTCNWTRKRTIMSKEDYKKNFKKKDCIK